MNFKIVDKPRSLFRPDPVLGWRLSPNHGVQVKHRPEVVQRIAPDGWRHIPRAVEPTGPRVAFYGCSFTYGTGLRDDETYTALLQHSRPELHILNRGVGGFGTVQNLLQFRRDIAAGAVDAAVFAIISDHRFRNIAHPQRMRQYLSREWYTLGVEHVPVARLNSTGEAQMVYVPIWQPVIRQANFDAFLPDDYMINAATLAVLGRVASEAHGAGVPVRFALLDALDASFTSAVCARFPDTLDVSTPYDQEHTFLPDDIHPNAKANALFAGRLMPLVDELCKPILDGQSA